MLKELITLGTKASSGSGMEPWGFVTLKDKEEIDMWSERLVCPMSMGYTKNEMNHLDIKEITVKHEALCKAICEKNVAEAFEICEAHIKYLIDFVEEHFK